MKELLSQTKVKMEKCVASLERELASVRAGRANPSVLDKISVDYYGVPTQINQMAAISVAEARVLVIQPWDMSQLNAIAKAIQASDLGITPTNDGKVLRIAFPQPTEERRKELVKQVSKYGEDGKIAVRNVRRDTLEKLKAMKSAGLSEDEIKSGEKDVQNLTDKFCKNIEVIVAEKDKEIMSI